MLGSVARSERSAAAALSAIREAGYDAIELNGFMIAPAGLVVRSLTRAAGMPVGRAGRLDWARLVEDAGLSVVALHTDLGGLKRDPSPFIASARRFGTHLAVITGMYRFDYSSESAVRGLCEDLNSCGAVLAKEGVELLYHNHNAELSYVSPGQRAFDVLIEQTDPDLVNFELDTYWLCEAGADPLAWMKRLGRRMRLHHISDRGFRMKTKHVTPILTSDTTELGSGNMDLDPLIRQALDVDVEGIILETHRNWVDRSPIKSLQTSGDYLRSRICAD